MFYRSDGDHGLAHDPFNALIIPRPIGWISSIDKCGNINLAPYSFFNAVAYTPPQVMFAAGGSHAEDGGVKDSVKNIQETKQFVVNIVSWGLKEAMNCSSASEARKVNEFDTANLEKIASVLVDVPRVKDCPAHLECKHTRTVKLMTNDKGEPNLVIFGQVIGIHINDAVLSDGFVDIKKMDVIGRLGYRDYVRVNNTFSMYPPK